MDVAIVDDADVDVVLTLVSKHKADWTSGKNRMDCKMLGRMGMKIEVTDIDCDCHWAPVPGVLLVVDMVLVLVVHVLLELSEPPTKRDLALMMLLRCECNNEH